MIFIVAALLLPVLLYFEKVESLTGKAASKFLLSSLFVTAALISPHPDSSYFLLILIGLLFCLAGDVLLAFPSASTFRMGLVSFLTGHLFYLAAFLRFFNFGSAFVIAVPAAAVTATIIYLRLLPYLGSMKIPVLAYICVISLMLIAAITAGAGGALSHKASLLIVLGAFLFYLSDIFVAKNRFIGKRFINRLIGLPLYYGGQFLLALSVGSVSSL
jgi:uncharacterized membrane protein YhhN